MASGATNRKGKDKEKKDVTRQTTLFGLPSKPLAEKKERPMKRGGEPETGANDIDVSTLAPRVPDVDTSDVPPPSEAATLIESQDTEKATTDDTQLAEDADEVPIEWEASPPPSPR